jgi:hypothetical protein
MLPAMQGKNYRFCSVQNKSIRHLTAESFVSAGDANISTKKDELCWLLLCKLSANVFNI